MTAPKIGLVLGAGGVTGGAFHAGALAALTDATGWDPRHADLIVGTSAGSLTGSLLRAGIGPEDLFAAATDRPVSPGVQARLERLDRSRAGWPPADRPRREVRLAEPRVLLSAARRPWRIRPGAVAAALLPAGVLPTAIISDGVGALFDTWPPERLWICAVRMHDARRVVFGRDGAPPARVGEAVAASCAIPGYFAPVRIGDARYVDGGAHSPTNLDLVRRDDLDLVIVSSPMSVAGRAPSLGADAIARRICRATLDAEALAVRRRGIPIVAFQPTAGDRAVMGLNPMDPGRRAATAEQIYTSTRARLERADLRRRLATLYERHGDPVTR